VARAPLVSRSSISACATAVRKSTSQTVGASVAYASPRRRWCTNAICEIRGVYNNDEQCYDLTICNDVTSLCRSR